VDAENILGWSLLAGAFVAGVLAGRRMKQGTANHPCAVAQGFHHDMRVIATQPHQMPDGALPHTVTLKYCPRCNEHFFHVAPGAWSVDQMLERQTEVERLRDLAKL
jgi:hypothetical protein